MVPSVVRVAIACGFFCAAVGAALAGLLGALNLWAVDSIPASVPATVSGAAAVLGFAVIGLVVGRVTQTRTLPR